MFCARGHARSVSQLEFDCSGDTVICRLEGALIPTFQELVAMFKKLCESLEARESSEAEPALQQEVCLIGQLLFMPSLRIGMFKTQSALGHTPP